jgi:hypothetical protein
MKLKGLVMLSVLTLFMAVSVNGWAETGNQTAKEVDQSKLYMKVPGAEHKKMFPKGHKDVAGKECIFDRETDSYFCQYYDQYDGYINK